MALETVLLHPLITKSGTKQKQNKESEKKRQQESISIQRNHATRATTCKKRKNCKQKKRKQTRPSTPDGVGDGVAAPIDHKERRKIRTEQRERDQETAVSISKQRNHATRAATCKKRKNCKQKRENKQRASAYLTALETVLLHPLITKSGTN